MHPVNRKGPPSPLGSATAERAYATFYKCSLATVVVSLSATVSGIYLLNDCIQDYRQTAADKHMLTIDKLWELVIALSKAPSPIPYDLPFSHNTLRDRRQTGRQTNRLYQRLVLSGRPKIHTREIVQQTIAALHAYESISFVHINLHMILHKLCTKYFK